MERGGVEGKRKERKEDKLCNYILIKIYEKIKRKKRHRHKMIPKYLLTHTTQNEPIIK